LSNPTLHQSKLPNSRATFAHAAFRFLQNISILSRITSYPRNARPSTVFLRLVQLAPTVLLSERNSFQTPSSPRQLVEMADSAPAVNGGSLLEATKSSEVRR
jgi:hypothetical protein